MVHVQDAGGIAVTTDAKWTFMVYMAGDNNLSAAADNDLAEMRAVGSTKDVNVVVEIDNAGSRGTRRFKVEKGAEGELVETLGETDSGDPETLFQFVQWAHAHHPAKHYCLVIWNHGSGWEPSEMDRIARYVGTAGYTGRETTSRNGSQLRRALFRPTIEQVYKLPTVEQRAIASDDGTGHSLDTVELGKVIRRIRETLGQPIDVLGLDACLMASLEVAYEIAGDVRYMVGSLDNEPNDGWPYDDILVELTAQRFVPSLPPWQFAAEIVEAYAKSYAPHNGNITQSAFDLSKIDELELPLACLCKALLDNMPQMRQRMYRAQTRSANFWGRTLWDLGDWCRELKAQSPPWDVAHAAKCVGQVLDRSGFVVANEHRGAKVRNVSGLSIYLPPELIDISPYYARLQFARETAWQGMLYAYHNGTREEPVPREGSPLVDPGEEQTRRLTKPEMLTTRRLVDTPAHYQV